MAGIAAYCLSDNKPSLKSLVQVNALTKAWVPIPSSLGSRKSCRCRAGHTVSTTMRLTALSLLRTGHHQGNLAIALALIGLIRPSLLLEQIRMKFGK